MSRMRLVYDRGTLGLYFLVWWMTLVATRMEAQPAVRDDFSMWDLRQNSVLWSLRAQGWEHWIPLKLGVDSMNQNPIPMDGSPAGSVFWDLFQQGMIPHPYAGRHAEYLGWVSDCTWVYKAEFHAANLMGESHYMRHSQLCQLLLSGLDTYASVSLNGHALGDFANPHRTYTVNLFNLDSAQGKLSSLLKSGWNELTFVLKPPLREASKRALHEPIPLPGGQWLHSRKAAYQFGWDWAKAMPSVGLSGRLELRSLTPHGVQSGHGQFIQIRTLYLDTFHHTAKLRLEGLDPIPTVGDSGEDLEWSLSGQGWSAEGSLANFEFTLQNPKLWWPVGMGEPYVHHALWTLKKKGGEVLRWDSVRFGIRTVELIQDPDSIGRTFYFRINGRYCYIKGANWVPHDLWPMVSDTVRTHRLLDLALKGGMNLIRVWGGGHYASDGLMDFCDRKGLMVWHDFAYACAMFPTASDFVEEAKAEAQEQVLRLRHHPSLILWCGNNEVEEGWQNWGWVNAMNYSPSDSAAVWHAYTRFFHHELPAMLSKLDRDRPYHPSSPSNGWGREVAYREGDIHQWSVWWGMQPFKAYAQKVGRFVSEFGFQGFPSRKCMRDFQWDQFSSLGDTVLRFHQNHPRGFETIEEYLRRDYLGPYGSLADSADDHDWVYWSGMLQADAMDEAIRAQRSHAPWCSGTIIWQLNDAWPVVSWSLVDYSMQPKPAWYAVRRVFDTNLPPQITGFPDTAWHWPCSHQQIGYRFERNAKDSTNLILVSKVPVHRLWLEGEGLTFEDNSLDLAPNQEYRIRMSGLSPFCTSMTLESFCPSLHGVDRWELPIPVSSRPPNTPIHE